MYHCIVRVIVLASFFLQKVADKIINVKRIGKISIFVYIMYLICSPDQTKIHELTHYPLAFLSCFPKRTEQTPICKWGKPQNCFVSEVHFPSSFECLQCHKQLVFFCVYAVFTVGGKNDSTVSCLSTNSWTWPFTSAGLSKWFSAVLRCMGTSSPPLQCALIVCICVFVASFLPLLSKHCPDLLIQRESLCPAPVPSKSLPGWVAVVVWLVEVWSTFMARPKLPL